MWHGVFFPPTFLYILINMSPFWYDRYFYCRPVWGVFTWRRRVKEATSEILYTNRRVWSEPARVFLHEHGWWDGHTSMVMLSSKSDPYPELQSDEETPSWALGVCICLMLLPSNSLPLLLFPLLSLTYNHKPRGGMMDSQNAHQNTSRNMRASY